MFRNTLYTFSLEHLQRCRLTSPRWCDFRFGLVQRNFSKEKAHRISKEQQTLNLIERIFEKVKRASMKTFCLKEESSKDPTSIIEKDLEQMKDNISKNFTTDHPILKMVAEYYFQLQGKRFRPMVLLLLSKAILSHKEKRNVLDVSPKQTQLAEIIEMIHTASIIHDDVIDDATTRRGEPAINHQFSNKMAILSGDYLLARASIRLSQLENFEVTRLISTIISDLVEGEFMQLHAIPAENDSLSSPFPSDLLLNENQLIPKASYSAFDHYLRKTYFKTASLIANSCRASAILNDSSPELIEIATEYGKNLGISFQLIDDLLDFTGSSEVLGKPAAVDLSLGLATAPVLFAREEYPDLSEMIARKFKKKGDVEKAYELVNKSQGLTKTHQLALSYTDKALSAIHTLHPSEGKTALEQVAQWVLARHK